jgi:hypothetical protein
VLGLLGVGAPSSSFASSLKAGSAARRTASSSVPVRSKEKCGSSPRGDFQMLIVVKPEARPGMSRVDRERAGDSCNAEAIGPSFWLVLIRGVLGIVSRRPCALTNADFEQRMAVQCGQPSTEVDHEDAPRN